MPPLLFADCRGSSATCRASTLPRLASGIERVTATQFLVDHRVVDAVLENQADLMRNARVVPTFVNGRTCPRLLGVRPDSLLATLGFREGDCIESVNGFDVSDPNRALEAYARLRSADTLVVRVRRYGTDLELEYTLW
jgi:general secretion pathway protein C